MATRKLAFYTVFSLALLSACASGFKAIYDSDPAHDFSNYQTFGWISQNPMIIGQTVQTHNPMLQPHIMSSLKTGLAAKGFRYVQDAENADFVLSFTVGSRDTIKIDSYPSAYGGYYRTGPGYRGWGGGYYGYATETKVRQYTEGMLAVDIFDVQKRQPVWHGAATKSITTKDRQNIQATVQAAVDAILVGFPPVSSR